MKFNEFVSFVFPQNLASRLCETINVTHGYCVAALNELQTNAVDKLKARDLFRESGTVFHISAEIFLAIN